MANEAAAWSLGKDGSWEGWTNQRWAVGCASVGRARSQMWEMIWLVSRARPAEASAEAVASRHFDTVPGRLTSQRPIVAAARTGTLQIVKSSISSPIRP